jgi:hypothetical protein
MRSILVLSLALAAMTTAGSCRADPSDRDNAAATCQQGGDRHDDDARCAPETGVIDHLPDSFFIGGGGVGPQVAETYESGRVWVYGSGEAAAGAHATASASASASVHVSVRVRTGGGRRY